MRKILYLFQQTLQSILYYKKRYMLYVVSFYVGLLLPVLCIANYNQIRNQFHYYVFDKIKQAFSINWQSYSFTGIDLEILAEHTISASCQEVFGDWDSRIMSIIGIQKNYYYYLPKVEGRMLTETEIAQGEYVCILDKETSQKYDCKVNETIVINGISFTVVGLSSDPVFTKHILIPITAMRKAYENSNLPIQFTGTFILEKNQNKEYFRKEVEDAVLIKDKEAEILFSITGKQMYENAQNSVGKWKFLRGLIAFGAFLFFTLNELVIIMGKVQKECKTIAIKMALGANKYTIAVHYLLEIVFVILIADLLIFLSIRKIVNVLRLEEIMLFDSFVIIVSLFVSVGIAIIITLVILKRLQNVTISKLMKLEDT